MIETITREDAGWLIDVPVDWKETDGLDADTYDMVAMVAGRR